MPKQTNPFRDCAEDEVFVVTTFEDGSVGRTRKKKTELTAEDKVLKCIVCGEPACWVDHLWPVETHDNRCEKHVNSLIDENVYDQYGVGVVVCRDHNIFLHIVYGMDACADWLMKHPENPDAEPLREKMIAFKQELDKFMAKQWPDEQFGPMQEERKMSEQTKTQTCKTCKYYDWIGMNVICRRFPPQVYALHRERRDAFPMVGIDDWCGEWKAKDAK